MTYAHPSTPDIKETAPTPSRLYYAYAPLLWAVVWMVRCGQRAGFIPLDFLMPSPAQTAPHIYPRNRQLRRARASCLRRAHAYRRKWRKPVNPANYTPRAYAHFAYVSMMPKHYTPGQFMEAYIRDNDLSRVQVYGMDAAHNICGFVPEAIKGLCQKLARLTHDMGVSALSLAAQSDPAPP